MKKTLFVVVLLQIACAHVPAQTFTQVSPNTSFDNTYGQLIMADLDNDGDAEIISSGRTSFSIFKNSNGTFDEVINYPEYYSNNHVYSLDAGDINNDGFIDILHGSDNLDFVKPQVLLNKSPGFINFDASDISGITASLYLGDFEGDGDLDVLSSGASGIAINRKGQWSTDYHFPNYGTWHANWCDFNHDSQLEVIQAYGGSNYFIANYLLEKGYPALSISKTLTFPNFIIDTDFADYDADGDLDMLAKQMDVNGNNVKLYKNVNNDFVDVGISFPWAQSIDFGDINNDGRYDVIIGGMMTETWYVFETGIYLNQGNDTFSKLNTTIPSIEWGWATVGDFEGDGDLDISSLAGAFKNNSPSANAAPVAPAVIGSNVSGSSVELLWQVASDDKTPTQSLTYNIYVRSEDGTVIVPAHALASGKRQIYKMGNAWNSLSFNLSCLKQGKYYWKVQTLDASYQGSSFSAEQSFTITTVPPLAPSALTATTVSDVQIDLSWEDQSTTEDSFIIFKKLKNEDNSFFYPFDTVMANETHYSDTLYLFPDTEYDYKVAASNCAYPDELFSTVSAKTFPRAFEEDPLLNLGNTAASVILLGDIDNDEDLDMFIVNSGSTGKILRFGPAGYEDPGINIPFSASHALWLDYNNDGFIDLLLYRTDFTTIARKLYRNESGTKFTEVNGVGIPQDINWQAGISLGDYNNDGDEDILVQASTGIHIYDNNGRGEFKRNTKITLNARLKSSRSFADFDRDGDLDILSIKGINCAPNTLIVFENKLDDTFVPHEFNSLQGLSNDYLNFTGDMEWGDYDSDGYPDIIIAGESTCSNGDGVTIIYHNNGAGGFELASNLVPLIYDPNVDWGDYDNDGDLDVFAYGNPRFTSARARVYRNEGEKFKESNVSYLLRNIQYGKAARGDVDADGDLDYVITGETDYPVNVKLIAYRNTYSEGWGRPNHKPSPPQSPQSVVNGQDVTLTWSKGDDQETKDTGLTYNLYIIDNKDSILANSYSLENGHRKVVSFGNASSQTSMKLYNLRAGTYRWAVQAIDKGFAGSEFSEENTFVIGEEEITGVEGNENNGVILYPNPASTSLTIISAHQAGSSQVEITNSVGQPMMKISLNSPEVHQDISSLPAGLYVVSVFKGGNKVDVVKLIKK